MYMFFKSINTCKCCSVLVVTYIYKKQRMYMLFNTRCNINMFFNKINRSTCHLIYFDEQCLFRQVGSQGQYTWWCLFGTPREIIHGRSRHAQHEGARRCRRSCADRDHLGEALAVATKDKLLSVPRL